MSTALVGGCCHLMGIARNIVSAESLENRKYWKDEKTMEIRLYDIKLAIADRHEEMELVKTVDIEMYSDLDFGGFISVDGKLYRHCTYHGVKDILAVEPVTLVERGEEINYSHDFICPYCGDIDNNACELDDEGETICGACGSDIEYERVVTIEYNIKPKKCAPITRV